MRIVMVKGFSKTGKTTTVTSLVKELRRRGYSVGTVKDIHYQGFAMDQPGTDTYKHAQAGAVRVAALGERETDLLFSRRMELDALLKYYKEDFVILEGDSGADCPVILTGKTEEDLDPKMSESVVAISGLIFSGRNSYILISSCMYSSIILAPSGFRLITGRPSVMYIVSRKECD